MTQAQPLTVYLPDTRGVTVSRYGRGNLKIGLGVYTYSRLPGSHYYRALGLGPGFYGAKSDRGTCPGATQECQEICYARRVVEERGPVFAMWQGNAGNDVPPIPEDCKLLRIHVSGDFDTVAYIRNWVTRLQERPDVIAWAYTRTWRLPAFLPALEELRALPNLQLFASMDPSCKDEPPKGWRRSWIWRDFDASIKSGLPMEDRLHWYPKITTAPDGLRSDTSEHNQFTDDGVPSYVCPEETGKKPNCEACGYCFRGKQHDVTFLEH